MWTASVEGLRTFVLLQGFALRGKGSKDKDSGFTIRVLG
jgi:hypothetical protein